MKIYERDLKKCVMLHTETADDGEGGSVETVTEGMEFEAAFVPKNITVKRMGEKKYHAAEYTAAVPFRSGAVTLKPGDRFRSVGDGLEFTVTGICEEPPASSVIQFRAVTAETWIGYGDKEAEA